ncbi:MAG: hypothetical protein VX564_05175 [Nitrospirota bacterium]|jgi:hypothetical protein|nr:hypothetical protein [Nitrospirota bacterium]
MWYFLMGIAGLWMVDGLALLVAPLRMVALLKESLVASPSIMNWSGLSVVLGLILLIQGGELPYHPLWLVTGLAMLGKGIFFLLASDEQRSMVLEWCLEREAVDYRFFGLGLCTLSLLLLDAVGAL